MALQDFQDLVPRLVRDASRQLNTGDYDRAIASAVRQYSQDAARQVVAVVQWADEGHFAFALPDGLDEDATILLAEYPLGRVPRETVEVGLYVTDGPLGLLCETRLPAGAQVRVTFTAPHRVAGGPDAADTVPLKHRDAVASYAAHLLCRELAALYSADRESSISADASSTESRARNFAARAREYRGAYYASLGIVDPMGSGAGGTGGSGGASSAANAGAGGTVSWGRRTRPWFTTNDPLVG